MDMKIWVFKYLVCHKMYLHRQEHSTYLALQSYTIVILTVGIYNKRFEIYAAEPDISSFLFHVLFFLFKTCSGHLSDLTHKALYNFLTYAVVLPNT